VRAFTGHLGGRDVPSGASGATSVESQGLSSGGSASGEVALRDERRRKRFNLAMTVRQERESGESNTNVLNEQPEARSINQQVGEEVNAEPPDVYQARDRARRVQPSSRCIAQAGEAESTATGNARNSMRWSETIKDRDRRAGHLYPLLLCRADMTLS
jgi:hypothetical protein